jgi:hypothetical protein
MKKGVILAAMALILAFAVVAFADKDASVYKGGDTVFVCGCGEGCDCFTVSRKEGRCACGKPLAQTVVDKVAEGKIYLTVHGETRTFPAKATYTCGCGEGCGCDTISQKPGKCACGKEMQKVE